ncbi:hypothetical protein COB57_00455 [Candidatus Peregrinibacteria bacterium]|nr:MAG: hypothetical protein COB57_00455 [Candidatus Peregrinibacteria bacterium]
MTHSLKFLELDIEDLTDQELNIASENMEKLDLADGNPGDCSYISEVIEQEIAKRFEEVMAQ